jgi:hypothetical protein
MTPMRRDAITLASAREATATRDARLRVAAVVPAGLVPAWVDEVLDALATDGRMELVIVVLGAPGEADPRASTASVAFRLYSALDRRVFAAGDDALATVPLGPGIAHRSRMASDQAAAAEVVRAEDADVVVALTNRKSHELATAARIGLIRLADASTSGVDLFDHVATGDSAFDVAVELVEPNAQTASVLARARVAVDPISLHRNRNRAYWQGARMIANVLGSLAEERSAHRAPGRIDTKQRPNARPGGRTVRRVASLVRRAGERQFRWRLFREEWLIAYRERRPPLSALETMEGFVPLPPTLGVSVMDPFLIDVDGRTHLFFESYSFEAGRAVIATVELGPGGLASRPQVVLERPYHLSYPFVFRWDGEFFMLPETSENKTIELYRAERFPDRWVLDRVLMRDLVAVDSTLIEHAGRLRLFVNIAGRGIGTTTELHLFSANDLFGPWRPHRRNPIVADDGRARPAGPIFEHDEALVRPSQDCTGAYGRAVVFNRIDRLDEGDYQETSVARIDPGWLEGNIGTHGYASTERYEVVDARRLSRRFHLASSRRR